MNAPAPPPRTVPRRGTIVRRLEALLEQGLTFGSLLIDPPWRYSNVATRAAAAGHYGTLSLEDLAALPLARLAAAHSHLWAWTTNAFLFETPRLFEAWGFGGCYVSTFVWCKEPLGMGNTFRCSHEFLLLAIRGGPRSFPRHDLRSWAVLPRGRHSAKPEEVRVWIEAVSPPPRLELFGRGAVDGDWFVFGDEVQTDLFSSDFTILD